MTLTVTMPASILAGPTGSIMGARDKTNEPPQILSGWKNIARHLGMGVRTVQRYERQLGLPVRRPAGKPRAAVVATKSELDAWVAASPIREEFQLTKLSPDFHALNMKEVKLRLEKMGELRDQMQMLRKELRMSAASLVKSIENLRGDLWPGRWPPPPLTRLEANPQTRRLQKWLSMETRGGKVS